MSLISQEKLAEELQVSAELVLQRLQTSFSTTDTWLLPARVFPETISALATCVVSGSDEELRTIHLPIQLPDSTERETPLNTLLFQCKTMGKNAFSTSEAGMLRLAAMTSDMQPRVEYIMHLVSRPHREVALRAELQAFKHPIETFRQTISEIAEKFGEWSKFITDLEREISKYMNIPSGGSPSEEELRVSRNELEKATEARNKAQGRWNELRDELIQFMKKEAPGAVSNDEIFDRVSELVAKGEDYWPGIIPALKIIWRGQKRNTKEYDARIKSHVESVTKLVGESATITKQAMDERIQTLHDEIATAKDDLEKAKQEYSACSERLVAVSHGHSQMNLELLARPKLDLETLKRVLQTSAQQLTLVQQQITGLTTWFKDLSIVIGTTISSYEAFQRGSMLDIPESSQETAKFSKFEKRTLLQNIINIQARLSAISRSSRTYVTISRCYIQDGLHSMERLSRADMDSFETNRRDLVKWCDKAFLEIENITASGAEEVSTDMEASISAICDAARGNPQFWGED
ncbi:uncharacterized protein BDV14DRAFT_175215 [Aspergillus stella-maris]|uniref:uncharacterized protein n=1 Tax=Aspergillus stella-maris TaxID=1810926 RepID=UPI003CCE0BBA